MQYWLLKTEPSVFAFEDFLKQPSHTTLWEGVRNFQARNFIRDQMQVGDLCFIYHSSTEIPGIAGIAKIVKAAYPDPSASNKKSEYFDEKPLKPGEAARWYSVDLQASQKFKNLISLAELRSNKKVADMLVLKRGMRLSVQPVTKGQWEQVCGMGTLQKV